MAETVLQGRKAAPGLALGPLVRLDAGAAPAVTTDAGGEPELRAAIASAIEALGVLAEASGEEGAGILGFQIAFLEDETLIDEALALIADGESALAAWRAVMAAQIAPFEAEEDDYFRARATDLKDIEARVTRALAGVDGDDEVWPEGAVLIGEDLPPSRFLAIDWRRAGGLALLAGSAASHVAMLARARGVPMVVELGSASAAAGTALLDGDAGCLLVGPDPTELAQWQARKAESVGAGSAMRARMAEPALTRGGRRVAVMVNVDDPAALDSAVLAACDGVGLMRTELLFDSRGALPDEARQHAIYRDLMDRLGGRPAIIRTLDVGGDKPIAGLDQPVESNPFLGLRGIRLCLERPVVFRTQLRALLRAAHERPLRIMLPMVAVQAEIDAARRLADACLAELRDEGLDATMPPIGIMVETPAAALTVDSLAADFFSIGSNDLTQYVMAASRDGAGRVAALLDPLHPAVLRLMAEVAESGARRGLEVGICGDAASDPALVPALLEIGLEKLSVAPAALAGVKHAIRQID